MVMKMASVTILMVHWMTTGSIRNPVATGSVLIYTTTIPERNICLAVINPENPTESFIPSLIEWLTGLFQAGGIFGKNVHKGFYNGFFRFSENRITVYCSGFLLMRLLNHFAFEVIIICLVIRTLTKFSNWIFAEWMTTSLSTSTESNSVRPR